MVVVFLFCYEISRRQEKELRIISSRIGTGGSVYPVGHGNCFTGQERLRTKREERLRERRGLFYGDEGNWCSRKHNSSLCNYPEAVKASCHRLAKGNKDLPAPVRLKFLVGTSMRLHCTMMCNA